MQLHENVYFYWGQLKILCIANSVENRETESEERERESEENNNKQTENLRTRAAEENSDIENRI